LRVDDNTKLYGRLLRGGDLREPRSRISETGNLSPSDIITDGIHPPVGRSFTYFLHLFPLSLKSSSLMLGYISNPYMLLAPRCPPRGRKPMIYDA